MKCKQWLALALCVLMFACMSLTAAATPEEDEDVTSMDTVSKVYSLHLSAVQGFIHSDPQIPAFWEYPALRAGEDYVEGTLVIRNDSEVATSLKLTSVSLPYGDKAKLNYLDHLMLTIKDGDTVLFDNTYAHINDEEGGLKLSLPEMQPGEEKVYSVKLRCLYSYDGNPANDATVLNWNFEAQMVRGAAVQTEKGAMPAWVLVVIIAAVVTAVLAGGVIAVYVMMMNRLPVKNEDDAEGEKKEENTH